MKLLDPKYWISQVKEIFRIEPYTRFFNQSQGVYLVPVFTWDYSDLVEVFGDDPRHIEEPRMSWQGDVTYKTKYLSEDEVSNQDLIKDLMPDLNSVAKKANDILGETYFEVEFSYKEETVEVYFIFQSEDVEPLKSKKVLSATPLLSSLIKSAHPAFSDFSGPFLERASVLVSFKKNPDGFSRPNLDSAKLVLPDITPEESQGLASDLFVTVKRAFEDEAATVQTYSFTFRVFDISFHSLANGQVRPRFKQELKKYKQS